jgi:hypothetical protein
MERDKQFLMIIIVLMGLCYYVLRSKISADETTQTLQDSISDHYRPYKLGYMNATAQLRYTDSLFKTGLIINLTASDGKNLTTR